MAGSVSAIRKTPPAQCSGSLRVNGMHFSAAHETENSTSSASNVMIRQALYRPASVSRLLPKAPRGKAPPHDREGLFACAADSHARSTGRTARGRTAFGWSAGTGVLAEFGGDRRGGAHPPCVDHQLRQACLIHLCQPEHHQ